MKDPLRAIPWLGPALREDLRRLKIDSVAALAGADPDDLYVRLGRLDGRLHDPCVWDQFACVIATAKGALPRPWWAWTPERKKRQAEGRFPRL